MQFSRDSCQTLTIYPASLPKRLIQALIAACLLLGLSGLRHGRGLVGWLTVIEHWLFMLLWIPVAVTVCALPFKLRDNSFELKLAYYLGMFVAFLFILNKLRYWR